MSLLHHPAQAGGIGTALFTRCRRRRLICGGSGRNTMHQITTHQAKNAHQGGTQQKAVCRMRFRSVPRHGKILLDLTLLPSQLAQFFQVVEMRPADAQQLCGFRNVSL
jgi:hypothetical protein